MIFNGMFSSALLSAGYDAPLPACIPENRNYSVDSHSAYSELVSVSPGDRWQILTITIGLILTPIF